LILPDIDDLSENLGDILTKLTGEVPIRDDYYITERFSSENRAETRQYLKAELQQLGLWYEEHTFDVWRNREGGCNVYTVLAGKILRTT
jgi:hypothetical protein